LSSIKEKSSRVEAREGGEVCEGKKNGNRTNKKSGGGVCQEKSAMVVFRGGTAPSQGKIKREEEKKGSKKGKKASKPERGEWIGGEQVA